jgi:hypothetical protein
MGIIAVMWTLTLPARNIKENNGGSATSSKSAFLQSTPKNQRILGFDGGTTSQTPRVSHSSTLKSVTFALESFT